MFAAAAHARRAILRNFEIINYKPDPEAWRSIRMGIKRDLQAQVLRPNVAIPPRRNPISYLRAMHRETGSLAAALASFAHDGSWTSSGGSFKLAEELGLDIVSEADRRFGTNGRFRYLEIGGAWAGFKGPDGPAPRHVAGLARYFERSLGRRVTLHFTNLTRWHKTLPDGVFEHPFMTAAGLAVVERQGIARGTVDILYSQAAAYFETDPEPFVLAASALLREEGLLIFNCRPTYHRWLAARAQASGLVPLGQRDLGGMNGIVLAFAKQAAPTLLDAHSFGDRMLLPGRIQALPADGVSQ